MKRKYIIFACILGTISLAAILSGCIESGETEKMIVVVTLAPQREMIRAIGGDKIKVTIMVPVGESPHSYAPVPSQMTEVAKAKVYMKVGSGVEFEVNYLDEIISQNKDLKIVDCSKGIDLIETGGGRYDPHIWLSPENVKVIVNNMCDGLVGVDSRNKDFYEENRDAYLTRLDELNSDLKDEFKDREGSFFLVYHPAWGYFARNYDLNQLAIEDEGKQPGPAGVTAIIDQAKEHGIKVILVSPQFDQSSAQVIADEIDGEVISVDPLAEDYIENLRDVATKMTEALAE